MRVIFGKCPPSFWFLIVAAVLLNTGCTLVGDAVFGCSNRFADAADDDRRLTLPYDINAIAEGLRSRNEYRVDKRSNYVQVRRGFKAGEDYMLQITDVEKLKAGAGIRFLIAGKAPCSTSYRTMARNLRTMIDDLPLDRRQKAELRGRIHLVTDGTWYSNWKWL